MILLRAASGKRSYTAADAENGGVKCWSDPITLPSLRHLSKETEMYYIHVLASDLDEERHTTDTGFIVHRNLC